MVFNIEATFSLDAIDSALFIDADTICSCVFHQNMMLGNLFFTIFNIYDLLYDPLTYFL